MTIDLSINGNPIKKFKNPHPRILKLKSLRIPRSDRNRIEKQLQEMTYAEKWTYFKSEVYHLHSLFFTLDPISTKHVKINDRFLLKVTRRVFYKVNVLCEVLINASIAKMLNDGFFFKPIYSNDPKYLHQLFDVVDVIFDHKIKI
jgi:hypothetical protein